MVKYKQKDPPLRSWSCDGCTNVCYLEIHGEVFKYCKPVIEGRLRTKWITDTFIDCLDKTTDPKAMDKVVRVHPAVMEEK